jgi:hypothetical protein
MTLPTTVPITAVKWDPSIYPRSKWSTSDIDRYVDFLEAGETLPPLVLEEGTNRLLDGKHRLEAHKRVGSENVPVRHDSIPDGVPAKLYSLSLSMRNGLAPARADVKTVIRGVYETNPEFKQADIVHLLGVSKSWVSENTSDITAKRREERRAKALRLYALGWTQEEIAARLTVARTTITGDVKEFGDELLDSGHAPEEIALRLGWPIQLVLAQQLDGQDDEARLKALGIKSQPYDVWQFPGCHDLMGDKHPGRIPGELVCHVLHFYTDPGDLVVDPMAGSGTTLDAALLMGRKARGYDIDHRHERIDVEEHNLDDGWPDTVAKARLVFWDPPYYDKMDHGTIGDDGYIEGSISGLDPDDYLDWLTDRFGDLAKDAKPGTLLAFLMSDWDPENAKRHGEHPGIFIWDYADRLISTGWSLRRQIQCPLPTQQIHPDIVNKHRAARRLGRLGRYLLVAET